jgi:hypothetical protein
MLVNGTGLSEPSLSGGHQIGPGTACLGDLTYTAQNGPL